MTDEVKVADDPKAETPKKESTRRKFRDPTWTDEQVAARKAELTVEAIPVTPDGRPWVKFSDAGDAFVAAGIPVTRLVRASGGDRGMGKPAGELWAIVYVGNTRYIHPDAITLGLDQMKSDPNLASTPRKPRAKKEAAEGDGTGAVKSSKKAKAPANPEGKETKQVSRSAVWEHKG